MKKLKRKIELNGSVLENKFDKFIFDNLDSYLGGDWTEYEDGDVVRYNIDLMEILDDEDKISFIDDWNECKNEDDKVDLGELKKYVDEGICYIDKNWGEDKCWYNVKFKGNVLKISFVFDESLS
jgi:hypothetical protein